MFDPSTLAVIDDSSQIVLNVGYTIFFIGIVWKMAVDHTKNKHKTEELEKQNKKTQAELEQHKKECKAELEKHEDDNKDVWDAHKQEHQEIKKTMDIYQVSIHDLRVDVKSLRDTSVLQFQMIETKIDQTQTMLLNIQNMIMNNKKNQ